MLTQVAINRASRNGLHADTLDVLERLAERFGSATNAAVQLIRTNPCFEEARQMARADSHKTITPGRRSARESS